MTYQQTVDYLFHRLPMFSRIGAAAIKKDLTNTIRLCEVLGNPQQRFKSIHIAGTNGKGSTSHMLAAILQQAGYKTGLYTSPHLYDFRERIRINGKMCTQQFVVDFTERIQPYIDTIDPSFFEITVAMAFEYFSTAQVDIAIIETGLGGRLDSTNIISPLVSVITNIGWDHMNLLGDTLEAIAGEKAGIIKENVPVVIGEKQEAIQQVFIDRASTLQAPLVFANEVSFIDSFSFDGNFLNLEVSRPAQDEKASYRLDLPGIYQAKNLLTVLETIHQLRLQGFTITEPDVHHALMHVQHLTGLHGRWEVISNAPKTILDVGHNVDGIQQVTRQLELEEYIHLHIVIGMVKDKDIDAVLAELPKNARYYFTKAQIPRALPEALLQQKAAIFGLAGKSYPDVNTAIQHARLHASDNDLILVCGSVFLVAEVKR